MVRSHQRFSKLLRVQLCKSFMAYCRPQTKFAKVMFLHLSVIHSIHSGGGEYLGRYTPLGRYTSQAGTSPG